MLQTYNKYSRMAIVANQKVQPWWTEFHGKNDLQLVDIEGVSFMDILMELIDEESYMEERSNPNFEELIRLGLNITWYSVKNTMPDYELFIINDCSAHI